MAHKLAVHIGMMIIMTLPASASANYTNELQSVFADDVIFDCGDWGAVRATAGDDNVKMHHYRLKSSTSMDYHRVMMWTPEHYELPSNTNFVSGAGYVTWVYAHPRGFKYQIIDEDGVTYTNESRALCIRYGCLEKPCNSYSCMNDNLDSVSQITTVTNGVDNVSISTKFTVEQHRTHNDGDKTHSTHYRTITQTIENVSVWKQVKTTINVSVSDYTDRCTVISVETPSNITGIRIDAVSQNITAFYEKHAYYMELNKTDAGHEFFYLKEHGFENHSNMPPIGVNLYSLPRDNYNVSVTLYTPFEVMNATITPVESLRGQVNDANTSFKSALCVIVVLFGIVFVGRSI